MNPLGVVEQVTTAWKPRNRLALVLGALLGAVVPVTTYVLAHHEAAADVPLWHQPIVVLVACGLAFSCTTVVEWGRRAFGGWVKGLAFAGLVEGTMVSVHEVADLGIAMLLVLVVINAIATGCTLALDRKGRVRATKPQKRRPRSRSGTRLRAV